MPRLLRSFVAVAVVIATTSSFAADTEAHNNPPPGFVALFNGKDTEGWWGLGHFDPRKLKAMSADQLAAKKADGAKSVAEHWSIDKGELVNDGHGAYLTTEKEYTDFELVLDYKTVAKADSGIYLRGTPQVQIWDTTEAGGKWKIGADKGSGGLYNNSGEGKHPLVHADNPFGEWNHFRIVMIGEKVTVYLNDKLVVNNATFGNFWDRKSPVFEKGFIQLQTHGGEIRFRNVFIRELPKPVYNVEEDLANGFVSLFNGKDMTGWEGAADKFEVQDGIMVSPKGGGGNLYTAKQYSNFAYRFDFKILSNANNGVGIRCERGKDAAYNGMEIQILDDNGPSYKNLKPYQYHGSIYGVSPSRRGQQMPLGVWNTEEIVADGNHIKVSLNGHVLVDANIEEVGKPKTIDGRNHPGLFNKTGYIGFLGHGHKIEFRNIRIKELE